MSYTATVARPRFICLRWNYRVTEPTRILGDKWERSYGDMEWHAAKRGNIHAVVFSRQQRR